MKKLLTPSLAAALLKRCGLFQRKPKGEAPEIVEFPLTETPEQAKLKPIVYRRFLGGDMREGAFAFVWRDSEALRFLSILEDSDPFNDAEPKQDVTWLKGDVMEVFFQPAGGKPYYEFHVAPNGATLELRVPSVESFRADPGGGFESRLFETDMEAEALLFESAPFKGWVGLISIPLKGKILGEASVKGSKFSVCRYNYNHKWGETPEISSISKFEKRIPSFHNPDCWQTIVFPL